MTRDQMPQRRLQAVEDINFGGQTYTVAVGFHDVAMTRIGEVFVDCHKRSSSVDTAARDMAILISLALQHGVSVETMRGAISRDETGDAAGLAGAVLDHIAGTK